MSTQSKSIPMLDLKIFVRVVGAVFCCSSTVSLTFTCLRFVNPELFYEDSLTGSDLGVHYFICALMFVTSVICFLSSCQVVNRLTEHNTSRNITIWLLLDSLFETSRVVYVFISEVVLKGKGVLQMYELIVSAALYLLDSFLYCQMILRH